MSLHLDFEPHSWYMGFAIEDNRDYKNGELRSWIGYTENGNTYQVDTTKAPTLEILKEETQRYHLKQHNGYGERIAKRRLEHLRAELRAERISYSELAELQSLKEYIDSSDVELLEAAGVPEHCEHVDFADTLDGYVCNGCGEESQDHDL